MPDHDAISAVTALAPPATQRIRPGTLIRRFCRPVRPTPRHHATAQGFCGYTGGRGDSLLTGFDDGYDFLGYMEEHGWRALPSYGDWPYVVYLAWRDTGAGITAITEYCEADLTVWLFQTHAAARAFLRTLREAP